MARHGLLLIRALLLVAVTASAMLVADYASAEHPAFCAEGGGCEAVQSSEYSAPLGVPLPFAGVVGFGSLFLLSLVRRSAARALLRLGLLVSGAIGAALVLLQARVIGAFCPLCLTVDLAAVVAAVLSLVATAFRPDRPDRLHVGSYVALLALAVAAPLLYRALVPSDAVPPALAAIYERTGARVVEVADFTCPHCRALYPRLEAAVRAESPPERVYRLMIDATGHPRSVEAASAYSCAERAGEGDAMAAVLFGETALAMPANEWARGAGIEADALARCMTSDSTGRALEANRELAEALGIRGIPTTFVGSEVLVGAASRARIDEALAMLDRQGREAAVPKGAYALGVIALAALIIAWGRSAVRRA